jgi:DNA-binding MarR family transcriptional regulator
VSMNDQEEAATVHAGAGTTSIRLGQLGDYVGFRLRRVQNRLSRRFAAVTADMGLRQGLFSSLAIVSANPGISQTDLSREVGLDKSVTVSMIDELERLGWAERQRSTLDRRRHALFVTPAGQEQLETLFALMAQTEADVLKRLGAEELATLFGLLDRIYQVVASDEV